MWIHHHRQASTYLQSFASECWMFHSYSMYQPSIRYKGVFVDILDGCYTHNLTLILSDQVLRVGRLSLNKLHVPGRRRRPHTTGVQDNAVLSSQEILSARLSRSFPPAGRTQCSSFLLPDSLLRRRHRFPSIAKRSTTILIRYCSSIVTLHKCKHYTDTQELP